MKGRQINFFAMPDEWEPLEKYLEENGILVLKQEMDSNKFEKTKLTNGELLKCLVNEKFIDSLSVQEKNNKYSINRNSSPLIEFRRSYFDSEKKLLRRGRFYYTKDFLDSNDNWKEKSEEFVKFGEKLFSWFKRNYKNSKLNGWNGFIVTEKVKKEVEKNYLKLTQV